MSGTGTTGLHWFDTGGEGVPLVFIHGWSCGHDDWQAQLDTLSRDFRCIGIDLPGHGRSERPAIPAIAAMAAGVNAMLDKLAVPGAVLVGHSMGCRVAMQTWADRPERVRGIVHVDGSLMEGDAEQVIARFQAEIAASGADALIDRLYKGFSVSSTPDAVLEGLARRRRAVDPSFLVPLFLDMIRWDITRSAELLSRIDIPVMLLQSTLLDSTGTRVAIKEGETTPWTRLVRARLPGARVVTIGGIGHFPMLESPERTNSLIKGFAQSLPERCAHDRDSGECSMCE